MFLNTLNNSNENLRQLLMLIEWSGDLLVSTFRKKHRPAVIETVEAKRLHKRVEDESLLFDMSASDAAKIEVR